MDAKETARYILNGLMLGEGESYQDLVERGVMTAAVQADRETEIGIVATMIEDAKCGDHVGRYDIALNILRRYFSSRMCQLSGDLHTQIEKLLCKVNPKPREEDMSTLTLKEMVKDKKVRFSFYRDGELWYTTEDGFEFPVPISDIGNATFNAEDKAILFMRYIRKHLHMLEQAKREQNA